MSETGIIDVGVEDAILATLPHVPRLGWTLEATRAGIAEAGGLADDARTLFPRGGVDLVLGFIALADRWMSEDAAAADMTGLRTAGRVREIIALRLARLRPHRAAVRRGIAVLAMPRHAARGLAATRTTVDAIWHAAGDMLADASRHTKRPLLAMAYAGTLLVWLRDSSDDDRVSLAFLDHRLADIARLGKIRARLGNISGRRTSDAQGANCRLISTL